MDRDLYKHTILNRKNFIVVYNTTKNQYELSEIKIAHVYWSSPSIVFCKTENGKRYPSNILMSDVKKISQQDLGRKFDRQMGIMEYLLMHGKI